MSQLSEVEKYFLERMSEANAGLWNALLTINGIMISAFALLPLRGQEQKSGLPSWLVALCALSILLILWNYLVVKWHYMEIGRALATGDRDLSAEARKKDIERANRKRILMLTRECIALVLLLVEVTLIGCMVFLEQST